MIRLIGGEDQQLVWTRWWCNTQLSSAWQEDPQRIEVTLGYLWGWFAALEERDEPWLRSQAPEVALRRISGEGEKTPLWRWLAASLLVTTKHWYGRMLSFAEDGAIPQYLHHVPTLPLVV
jgi:hypothetical protein